MIFHHEGTKFHDSYRNIVVKNDDSFMHYEVTEKALASFKFENRCLARLYIMRNWSGIPFAFALSMNALTPCRSDNICLGPARAALLLPPVRSGPVPAVVIMNSSVGVVGIREWYYGRFLAAHGLAACVVDSFTSRGIRETMTNQSRIRDVDMEQDAYNAFDLLAADPRIDPCRIALLGVSKGGLITLHTALTVRRAWMSRPAHDFAARVAIVPPAHMQHRDARTDGRPMLVLLGGRDNYTGSDQARDYARRIGDAGNAGVHVRTYSDAHHGWEKTGAPVFLPDVENYSSMDCRIEDEGTLTSSLWSGAWTMEEFFSRRQRFCSRGAHVGGGTVPFKEQVCREILEFFQAALPAVKNYPTHNRRDKHERNRKG